MAGDSTDRQMAQAIRKTGLLWLCTFEKMTEHLGNQLTPQWIEKLKRYGISTDLNEKKKSFVSSRNNKGLTDRIIKHKTFQNFAKMMIEKLTALRH